MLPELGLLGLRSRVPRQLLKLSIRQAQSLLVKLGLPNSQSRVPRQKLTLAESFAEAGPSWPRANGVDSAAATAAVKSAGKARPPGIPKQCATTKPELAESSGGAGPSWSKASGMNSAAATAAVKSAGF